MLENHSFCKHFRTTKYYLGFSIVQLVLTVLIMTFLALFESDYAIEVEIIIAVLLFGDMLIKFLSDERYFKKYANLVDCGLLAMLVVFIVLEISFSVISNLMGEISSIVLVIRYGVQIYRIITLIKQSKEITDLQSLGDIKFEEIQIGEEIDGYTKEKDEPKAH